MKMPRFEGQLLDRVSNDFTKIIEMALKALLEEKHLYQNFRIEPPPYELIFEALQELLSGATDYPPEIEESCKFVHSAFPDIKWLIENPFGRRGDPGYLVQSDESDYIYASLGITPLGVKLYCRFCKRIEPFNFVQGQDLLDDIRDLNSFDEPVNFQIFSFAYECQSCKNLPEIFLIRRERAKITLTGRSQIEIIEVPSFLPEDQKRFFSDAILAFNSGQILAGNFLLRTFIEQSVRAMSENPQTHDIEQLFSIYNSMLDSVFRDRFPSLYAIYNTLSEDIHLAQGSEETFKNARIGIEAHFDAKRMFESSHYHPTSAAPDQATPGG